MKLIFSFLLVMTFNSNAQVATPEEPCQGIVKCFYSDEAGSENNMNLQIQELIDSVNKVAFTPFNKVVIKDSGKKYILALGNTTYDTAYLYIWTAELDPPINSDDDLVPGEKVLNGQPIAECVLVDNDQTEIKNYRCSESGRLWINAKESK